MTLSRTTSRPPGPLRRSARLSAADWSRTVYVAVVLGAVELGVRVLPLPTVARLLRVQLRWASPTDEGADAPTDPPPASLFTREERRRIAALNRLTRNLYRRRGACLRRSLVLGALLRRHGARVRLGVRRDHATVFAHAWVEVEGFSLDPGDGYQPLLFLS